jgi:AAA+ superfamily predicted ATPase
VSEGIRRTEELELFELQTEIPKERLHKQSERLVGFQERYKRLHRDLRLLMDREGLERWSRKHYGRVVPLVVTVEDRYPLVLFHGDVGTGKTVTAEGCADRLARELGVEGTLLKLSTRVRGHGMVGQMTDLIAKAFDVLCQRAGKNRMAVLIIDEADSLAASRETIHSHHEDKAAVNTLIQRIDDVRGFGGRVLVFLCTNRIDALDPAILRRAGVREEFQRPGPRERRQLLVMDCDGLDLREDTVEELVRLTGGGGNDQLGFTYSDIRTRLLPQAMAAAFPDRKVTDDDLIAVAKELKPTPAIVEV